MARPSVDWVAGDPTWSRVYTAIGWATLPVAVLFGAVFVLNILSNAGEIDSAQLGILSWASLSGFPWVWAWIGPILLLTFLTEVLRTRKGVFKVAPTDRGLAIRFPLRTRVIPWAAVSWMSPTRFEWIQRWASLRVTVTREQSDRIYRWFYPR